MMEEASIPDYVRAMLTSNDKGQGLMKNITEMRPQPSVKRQS